MSQTREHPRAQAVVRLTRSRRLRHLSDAEWGQPKAEDYIIGSYDRGGYEPRVRGRHNVEAQLAILEHAERAWLERHREAGVVWVCVKSRRSGRVFRYRRRPSSSLVRWMLWRWEQRRAREERFARCTCRWRDEQCPLCVEAYPEREDEGDDFLGR